jgi:hypothetical protein
MALVEPIKIKGLSEFNKALRQMDSDLPKALREANNKAADIVAGWARSRVPTRTGHAAGTVKAKSTRTESRVSGGSKKYPYYPWLDFGGKVGRRRSVSRPFIKAGRFIYPGYAENAGQVQDVLLAALIEVGRDAGLDVSNE